MQITVEGQGFDDLLTRLQRLGRNADAIMDTALERGAKRLQSEIKPLVPVDEGTLRNSISVENVSHLAYAVGTNIDYAVYVEYGTGKQGDVTVPHTTKDSWVYYSTKLGRFVTTIGQPPTHFMHDGFINGKDAAIDEVRKELIRWLT